MFAVAAAIVIPSKASAQATFHGIGDLPGGPTASEVRDATKVGGVIHAVGAGAANTQVLCGTPTSPPDCNTFAIGPDTAVLWRWDGSAASLSPLPNLVVNTSATTFIAASAITPDGSYIASRARSHASNGQRQAVRVATAALPGAGANLNLSSRFSPALSANTYATAISNDGSILYGISTSLSRAVRFDATGVTSAVIAPVPGTSSNTVAARGTSADGSVMVGTSGPWAFRYVHGSGSTTIPRLPGGTWNQALAVSPDGSLVLVAGDSSAYPNGEVYLHNATSGAAVSLGSPNSPWSPTNVAGMTPDGSLVAVHFSGPTRGFAYFRNSHGWFLLASALAANGIDVKADGWTELAVFGMSSDGTLVFGRGMHNGNVEGYVAEFPAGYLAGFNPQPVAPSDTSIVGAWHIEDADTSSPAVVVFMADGTYYLLNGEVLPTETSAAAGFERGLYTWDAATGAFRVTTLNDTNGDAGLSDNNGMLDAALFVSGDSLSLTAGGPPIATRLSAPSNTALGDTLTGAWVIGNPAPADSSFVIVFDSNGQYYQAQDGPNGGGARDGVEQGTFAWDPVSHTLVPTSIAVDTNGDWGLSDPFGQIIVAPLVDGLVARAGDDSGLLDAFRVIDPATVVPTIASALTAEGALGVPFSYAVTATHGAFQFAASGLPAGLSIDAATGVISGTPTVIGVFPVALAASNSLRSGAAVLTLTVITQAATAQGANVTVAPVVPPGVPPLSITFESVAGAGTTAVTVLDPDAAPSLPPSGAYSLGDPAIVYEITTTAPRPEGSAAMLCFNYAGIDFGTNSPRLLHFEDGNWKDITTSVDAATTTICGRTTSFSPFTIAGSPTPFVTWSGFYSPVSRLPGFLNTVKGGSTVPLKFNVYVNGIEKTDTEGLRFAQAPVACALTPEDQVDFLSTGDTSLRYDATERQFVQNWKTPKQPGSCYVVSVTSVEDGRSIRAHFRLK